MSDTFEVNVNPAQKINVTVRPPEGNPFCRVSVSSRVVQISSPGTRKIGVVATAKGQKGDKGNKGDGVPLGGVAGQVLVKLSSDNLDTEWRSLFYFGTGSPPDPATVPEGSLFFKIEE